ncbi:TrbG/VirB9 family P-type conjugative transfer protein [Qipengyuania vesicularis]|uniref:TrbG/VirB9 family P-type conjugative transfer protein n=1 Tax=Qipengyuania vesicularis TaxID=2867232 RepID=UPI001C87FA91|nr:TrbG/VirB9 family P-type conjugative transfer protein [Qipengyuania vesicularis]MBX7526093.1 TrbG/VirB9 family P-type conjugative transfer protein [Qipengyuania vesicularis]
MNRALLTALALSLAATPALADSRLQEVTYDESEVFTLHGRVNVQASIIFGDDETIENVAIGNSSTWQVTPNKRANMLFVKPLDPRASTNLTVVTSKRTYLFDLVASPTAKPVYVLRFDYPADPAETTDTPQASQLAEAEQPADPFASVDPSDLNFAWSGEGSASLLPDRAFDDGEATFLTWPTGRDVPAILRTNSKGEEGPVNYTVRGDTIVIDGVPRRLVLRAGEDSAVLINSGPERSATRTRSDAAFAQRGD